jgi:hypothetical protein
MALLPPALAHARSFCPTENLQPVPLIRTISTGEVHTVFAPTAVSITFRDGLLLRQP